MSINVEMIGGSLLVQNYVERIGEKDHVKLVSTTDVFSPNGRTTSEVTWDLSVKKIDDNSCEYTNHVTARATEPFLTFIKEHGISFEEAAAARQKASSLHNQGETPLFAKSIERATLTRA
jgi:hypothetical protein